MSRTPQPCDVPTGEHSTAPARLYPCGWRCDRHSPWARAGLPEPSPRPDPAAAAADENGTP
jgi:hypothetical protein